MKLRVDTVSIGGLMSILAMPTGWSHSQEFNEIECKNKRIYGTVTRTSTGYGITVTYTENYSYATNEPSIIQPTTEGVDEVWTIKGVHIVDLINGNGDRLSASDVADVLEMSRCRDVRYEAVYDVAAG